MIGRTRKRRRKAVTEATSAGIAPAALLTEAEAGRELALAVKTLQRWRWSGRGPRFIKLGGAVRYRREDLEAFIERAVRTSTSAAAA